MKRIRNSRTVLDRLVSVGTNINDIETRYPNWLMNSKSEWGRGKLVRFEPIITRM